MPNKQYIACELETPVGPPATFPLAGDKARDNRVNNGLKTHCTVTEAVTA